MDGVDIEGLVVPDISSRNQGLLRLRIKVLLKYGLRISNMFWLVLFDIFAQQYRFVIFLSKRLIFV